jgi:methyl-accepting chemotaxis protein
MEQHAFPETETLEEQVATALPMLDVMGTQLKQTSDQIETAVMDVCTRFQSMMQRARAGVTSASELLSGEGSGESTGRSRESIGVLIEEAQQTIESLLQHTQHSAQVSQSAIERINRVRAATDDITKSLAQLDDITIGNRLLAVNARIQAVYAGDRAAGFGGVANEIAVQARRSSEIVDLIRSVSGELRTISQAALTDLQTMAADDQRAMERSKQEVDRVLEDFRRMNGHTRQFIEKMTRENASVVDEISAAVRSLQFQDRISQRMAHVIGELDGLRKAFSKHTQNVTVDSKAVMDRLSSLYTMHEERSVLGGSSDASLSDGDVELF